MVVGNISILDPLYIARKRDDLIEEIECDDNDDRCYEEAYEEGGSSPGEYTMHRSDLEIIWKDSRSWKS